MEFQSYNRFLHKKTLSSKRKVYPTNFEIAMKTQSPLNDFLDRAWVNCVNGAILVVHQYEIQLELLCYEDYLHFCNNLNSSTKTVTWEYKYNPNSETNKIFVFGSNLAGIHGAGAAKTAKNLWGAKSGIGEGLQGSSYAFPTKNRSIQSFNSTKSLIPYRDNFLCTATENPHLQFNLTRIGCGLAGYNETEIIELFRTDLPPNINLPYTWYKILRS